MPSYVFVLSAIAALAGLLFGFDTAVINGVLVFLRQRMGWSDGQIEVAAGSLLIGALAGSGFAGMAADRWGRKRTLLAAALLFTASSIWTALPNSLEQFVLARFTAGLAIGVASVIAPMYIAEISPPAARGRLVTLNQMAIVTGILLSYFVNWLLADAGMNNWRWMFATAAVPSLFFFFSLLAIPESPRWLLRWGRDAEASAILVRFHGEEQARSEIAEIRASLATESGSYRELLEPAVRRPLLLAVTLAIFSQVTGINTVIYYGSLLLNEHGGQGSAADAIGANVTIGAVNFLATIAAIAWIDRAGRRPLLLTGVGGMGVALAGVSFLFGMKPVPAPWVLAGILLYVAFFAISLGPGAWLYISELFPNAIRGRAMSIATLSLWAACTLVAMTFLTLTRHFGAVGAFRLYAGLCLAAFVFIVTSLPETKGRTLEQIGASWRRK